MELNVGIITQARMTSTRLPGKVLKMIDQKPLLQYHMERLLHTGFDIAIATTPNKSDDPICEFAEEHNIKFHRGSEENVLSRYFETAAKYQYDCIVRVTSDCPLIDPKLIREGVEIFSQANNSNLYVSNVIERTYARGFDFEIFSFDTLRDANTNAKDQSDLEHVTPYIWKNRSGKTDFYHVKQGSNNSRFRITIDTAEDFELVKQLIKRFNAPNLHSDEIENILIQHPELVAINYKVGQKEI
jgi:spore coat polysaccharide biosynthesis protein SpsF